MIHILTKRLKEAIDMFKYVRAKGPLQRNAPQLKARITLSKTYDAQMGFGAGDHTTESNFLISGIDLTDVALHLQNVMVQENAELLSLEYQGPFQVNKGFI